MIRFDPRSSTIVFDTAIDAVDFVNAFLPGAKTRGAKRASQGKVTRARLATRTGLPDKRRWSATRKQRNAISESWSAAKKVAKAQGRTDIAQVRSELSAERKRVNSTRKVG
jgi:hypothetical protein